MSTSGQTPVLATSCKFCLQTDTKTIWNKNINTNNEQVRTGDPYWPLVANFAHRDQTAATRLKGERVVVLLPPWTMMVNPIHAIAHILCERERTLLHCVGKIQKGSKNTNTIGQQIPCTGAHSMLAVGGTAWHCCELFFLQVAQLRRPLVL